MEIRFSKGKTRNTLTCIRMDGTFTKVTLGYDIPNHDLAHYVIESHFDMRHGFYGSIQSGLTLAQMSDKTVIKNLGQESWLSEIMIRNLQSLRTGAVKTNQYSELVLWEANNLDEIQVPDLTLDTVEKLKSDFDKLCEEWDSVLEDGELKLMF